MSTFIASAPCCTGTDHPRTEACTYRVAWAINPHMTIGSVDPARACAQHAALLRTVRTLGARVIEIPFVHGGFDSVFAKDNALYLQRAGHIHAMLGAFRHDERAREQLGRARALRRLGVQVAERTPAFEGGDLCVMSGQRAWLGYGFRSSPEAAPALSATLGIPVTPLELVEPELYHLDTALAALADGTVLACAEAFSPASRAMLAATAGDVIWCPREDAGRFALNFVEIGDTLVTGTEAPRIARALAARGRRVIVTPLDEFQRAGGSAACLLAPVHELATARIATAA